jgi:glycosyltransferase involved in cell wall biosynthesis
MDDALEFMKVSILFITYNHHRFVAEAIRSAMAQDYPDLELVVCDDASSDNTRSILEEEIKRCPPHVTLVRAHSETNLGLIENFNRGMAACSGDIIMVMAGDDISLPQRASRIAAEFATNPKCMLVFSNWIRIREEGQVLPGVCGREKNQIFYHGTRPHNIYASGKGAGATAAYRAVIFRTFGPLGNSSRTEDRCYWVRALLLGKVHYLAEPLVKWRVHATNLSNYRAGTNTTAARKRILRNMLQRQSYGRQFRKDIEHAIREKLIDQKFAERLFRIIRHDRERERLRRFSLAVAPCKLWLGSAFRLMKISPSPRNLLRVSFADLPIRISRKRRERRWMKQIRKGRS